MHDARAYYVMLGSLFERPLRTLCLGAVWRDDADSKLFNAPPGTVR